MRTPVIALSMVLALASGAAHAATAKWDFEADATSFKNTNGFEGTFEQVYGGATSTKSGISLGATAYRDTNLDGTVDHPNLDGSGNPIAVTPFMDAGNAGLGVCSTGFDAGARGGVGESRCSTQYSGSPKDAGDDNLVDPEVLKLTFSTSVSLEELVIRNGGHNLVSGGLLISLDGIFDSTADLISINSSGQADLSGLGSSTMFWFSSASDLDGVARPEIYLDTMTVSSVPVPAALPLLIAGLGGLGLMKRRQRKVS